VNDIAFEVLVLYKCTTEFLLHFPLVQNMCEILLQPNKNLDLTSLRKTNRKFFLRFFWHFDHYTLNAYRSDELIS